MDSKFKKNDKVEVLPPKVADDWTGRVLCVVEVPPRSRISGSQDYGLSWHPYGDVDVWITEERLKKVEPKSPAKENDMGFIIVLEPQKEARAVEHEGPVELDDLYRILGCHTVDCRRLGEVMPGISVDLWCDDEGLLNDSVLANRKLGSWTVCGTFLLCTSSQDGDSLPFADERTAGLVMNVARRWPLLLSSHPKPEPTITVTTWDD